MHLFSPPAAHGKMVAPSSVNCVESMARRNSLITAASEAAMRAVADSTPDTQVIDEDMDETQVPDIN